MSFQRNPLYLSNAAKVSRTSVTFCSCFLDGTKVEQKSIKREIAIMWIKDAAAGAGLILFMVSAFVLAGGAHAILGSST